MPLHEWLNGNGKGWRISLSSNQSCDHRHTHKHLTSQSRDSTKRVGHKCQGFRKCPPMKEVKGEDFDHPISLVGVGCTTRFHSPRTARPRSVQSGKVTMRAAVCHLFGEERRPFARWPRGLSYMRHPRVHRGCCTSAKTDRKENCLNPASLRNRLGHWCRPPSPGF